MMMNAQKGSGLIVVILVLAFMLAVGIAVLTVTGTGSKVSGNVRNQEEAFNAAEAGFETARHFIGNALTSGAWSGFEGHYLQEPTGIELPASDNYFRRRTDEELLSALSASTTNILYYHQPFVRTPAGTDDPRFTYTVFIIDDEAGGGTSDPDDVLLVSIGAVRAGTRIVATSRLEIVLAMP